MKSILGQLRCRTWPSNGKLEQCAPQKSGRIRAQLRVRVDQWVVDMPEMLRPGLDRGEGESVKGNLNSAQSRRMA
jgi:hypothetical protein